MSNSPSHRLFTAVLPPREIIAELDDALELPRSLSGPAVRWSPLENWHVTLLFTPTLADDALDDYAAALAGVAAQSAPFPLAVSGGGAFPRLAAARHLVALLDDPDEGLPALAAGCRRVAGPLGIGFEHRPYQPHLTLARLNRPADQSASEPWLSRLTTSSWWADRLALVESVQGPRNHSQYAVVESWQLTGRPQQRPAG
ncbi:RNA 2',3'-cyclic phosphodiesterase [Luteococcus sp. H138]|uniref:RNA 2',3'-cyclic phosphodiesterase n=1 Tax=unclassified Luteococcus TaxID=2639923 RepID=UPI00313E81B6